MYNEEIPSLENIQGCSLPDICPFCGKQLKIKEPESSKRTSLEDLRCLCCNEIACRCGCGYIYFPKFLGIDEKTNKRIIDKTCPICKSDKPRNH